ncbi:mediator of RNA polymerase II transcription subunit 13 [Spodoptera litura]|uniref:Mediator of RNA polymerase II transcription subunit 13 n=1 Tax=Spodoptera litura TaxID=69820 RepID=A0A9J7DY68_SPOLT|nr:mediator of RNA polymerase II transcription subunit 13 [Spodoptera litura]
MTHQNHQTNGASLEDCHTNFFALTELYGIKWRKLVWGETNGGGDGEEGGAPLADPVISSYARCLAGDILCVWRRVPAPPPPDNIYEISTPVPPPLSLRAAKELWIFWYGEEPDLNGLVAPELITSQGDQGSWESGLSYECRSLLFKALHNLIERCLLSRDFVRLGKWFVQPYDGDEEEVGKSPWHLSFSFAFFLHGESTVCASVDVRQHPPVRTLTAKRLAKINSPDNQADAKVILAPFGLEGTLTGREWSDADAGTARLLDAWRQLYPLEQGCGAVEVVCGGARMRYPWPYVLVTHMEAAPAARPSAAPARTLAALTTPAPHKAPEICYGEAAGDKTEDFIDPTRKTPCTCAKGPGAACSPASCGGGSPAPGGSAPPSAGAPPPSPHHQPLPNHQSTGIVPTTLHTPAPTPDPHAPPTPAPPSLPPPKTYTQAGPEGAWRRPVLAAGAARADPAEDEHALHMLYDYTTVHAWLEHPVKRFKSSQNSFREEMALGAGAAGDLYAGHDHTKMAAMRDSQQDLKQEKLDHNEDTKEYKNLFTSDGLCPTLKDLEQIFDNSDDAASGDETVRLLQVATPPEAKCGEESRCGRGCPRAEELSKMFPTPPSMEAHAQASPGFSLPDDATPLRAGSPPPDQAIEDWSYVFKPPTLYKYVGSSKYAPLTTLPSQLLPPVTLPPHAVYRPRYQDHDHDQPKPRDEADPDTARPQTGVKRSAPPTPESRDARPRRPCDTAPSSAGPGARTGTTTTSTSCVAVSRAGRRGPESAPAAPHAACPLMLNVLLADTVLNVFRDHNFDSCTLCVCNAGPKVVGNIRGADAATYLSGCTGMGGGGPGGAGGTSPASADEEPSHCTCGFSAILNRRRAHRAGLFYEDEMEITGLAEEPGEGGQGAGLGEVARVVLAQSAAPAGGPASALARAATAAASHPPADELRLNLLEYVYTPAFGAGGGAGGAADVRALAFSVFSGARRLLQHHANGKSLTGFGTAADANLFLQGKDEKNREPYKLFSPAWVLAAPRALKEVAETWGQGGGEQGGVLFLAYCLSHDQRWLLAAATDARGELLDTAAINIHVPHRSRRRRSGPARRLGLTKLMDFTLGVMSQAAQPWRLVVGRVGRIGHGELKGWSWLLSRKHLVRASATLREICGSCTVLYPGGVPCILSACLVSTEPDSCLRLMADRFTPDERFSQASIQSHLHTPRDVTATHILVFPTSATTQSNQMPFEPPMANGEDSDMMFLNVDMGDEDMGEDNMTDLLIGDMFNNMWAAGSPRRTDDDPAGSPQAHHHHQAAFHHQDDNTTEAVGALLQQPLALGYMVSTAPLGAMPAWWWAGCAHLRDACPAFLKTALHLHAGSLQAADDYTSLTQRRDHNTHPLDSQTTTDVLRYVLEGYNALSWLALDGSTHDRLSCLPLHVQVLMQLYHTAAALG